jgi:hypothetical protein
MSTILNRYVRYVAVVAFTIVLTLNAPASSTSFAVQTFAGGTTLGTTQPDSIYMGDGSVWVSYQNGADSTGASGSSTVVRYSPAGLVQNTWSIAGNVDGLRVDPGTGLVWALQNNDGNSTLTIINPFSNSTTLYTYGSSYTNVANRGFDDVVFTKGGTFISETNPAAPSDPTVLKLTSGLKQPLQVSGILTSQFTGTNLAGGGSATNNILDSDSLVLRPNGDLVLTGEADGQLVFIHNAGTAGQSQSFINLLGTGGLPIGMKVDDSAFNGNATQGYFLMTDTGANTVYKISATGLSPNMTFVDVGNVFGSVDLTTGIVTPIFVGNTPHGLEFVATPEPGSLFLLSSGLIGIAASLRRKMIR